MEDYDFDISDFRLYFGMPRFASNYSKYKNFLVSGDVVNLLGSFYYREVFLDACKFLIEARHAKKVNLMIDSGAFSMANSSKVEKIDRQDYAEFLNSFPAHHFSSVVAINLDEFFLRGTPTIQEIEEACRIGFENWLWLRKHVQNILILPVLHAGEPFHWWKKILEIEHNWIALGALAGSLTRKQRDYELSRMFSFCKREKFKGRIHGLGVTDSFLVKKFPFYSVDSVTYFKGTGFGSISIFDEVMGLMKIIYISELRPGTYLSEKTKNWILERTRVEFINKWDDLKNYWNRQVVSLMNFKAFEQFIKENRQIMGEEKLYFQQTIDLFLENENE